MRERLDNADRLSTVENADRAVYQERGEGIGLSIVKRLCELLDATVEMESTPGEGTILRIIFPRRYLVVEPKK